MGSLGLSKSCPRNSSVSDDSDNVPGSNANNDRGNDKQKKRKPDDNENVNENSSIQVVAKRDRRIKLLS